MIPQCIRLWHGGGKDKACVFALQQSTATTSFEIAFEGGILFDALAR